MAEPERKTLVVDESGRGDYRTLTEAVAACAETPELPVRFYIKHGIYEERPFIELADYIIEGEYRNATVITASVGGRDPWPGEAKTGTFRSETLFLGGGRAVVRNLTIQNNAGDGAKAGQALAVYADASRVLMEDVNLYGNQDTLFTAPLPLQEREKNGFRGPRENAPRLDTTQYYRRCTIRGNIDFIFGGADALFEQCTLRTVNNGLPHSWVTAPSGAADGLGFVFWDCDFVSDSCPQGTVYLGRPWRPTGKTAVLASRLGAHIAPEGFAGWNDRTDSDLARFAEAGNTGAGAGPRGPWVQALDETQAGALLCAARRRCRPE